MEFSESDTFVVLYASMLSVLPIEKMIDVTIHEKKLIFFLFEGLLEFAEK